MPDKAAAHRTVYGQRTALPGDRPRRPYASAVLTLYVDLPDTPLRASIRDQRLAQLLFGMGIPLSLVETALLLASLRRLCRPSDLRPLPRIRSLGYFQPAIEELQDHPVPDG